MPMGTLGKAATILMSACVSKVREAVKRLLLIGVLLGFAFSGLSAVADDSQGCGNGAMQPTTSCAHVATAQKPAILQVPVGTMKGDALELTARQVTGESAP